MRSSLVGWIGLLIAVAVVTAPRSSAGCVGDCNGDATVSVDELIRAVSISLGTATIDTCDAIDNNRDGTVAVSELVRGVGKSLGGCALGNAGEVLFSLQGNQLDEYDLATGARITAVPSSHATVNGQACLLPGGAGNFVVGEDTGQPEVRPGWGIFSPDGTFLQKLPLPPRENETLVGDPIGCAVDAAGRLFGTAIGTQAGADGQLVVFFPPDYAESCILDQTLHTPGMMALDDAGVLYVTEAGPPGKVVRFAPPFPANAAECGSVALTKTPFIEYTDPVASLGIVRGPAVSINRHWFVSQVVGLGTSRAGIREHDANGNFIRELFPPGTWGNPAGLAFDAAGSLYYADLGLSPQFEPADGKATVRRITFADDGTPSEPELIRGGLSYADGVTVLPSRADEWLTLGGSLRRTYFNPREHRITPATARDLVIKWRYLTNGMISAQAAVTWIDLPGEGRTQVAIVPSWDRHVYALRMENGSRVWQYEMKPQRGAHYPFAGSATVAWIDGQQRVFIPGGETLYCLDARTGEEIWQFDAGTGCTDCSAREERNEIESTPAVINGLVIVGMDTNDSTPGKGGMLALRADDGRLVWWFDLVTAYTCRPLPEDNVRRFDGFHTEAELRLRAGFLATRPGCNFDRTGVGCGNVWSSAAIDARRGLLYTASSNCDVDDDPSTPPPPPPMPPYEEAIFALTLNGDPVWVWRARDVDPDDYDFGAVPNLFEAEIGGEVREVVGIGGKDGTYFVLDRDGVNELSGRIEPYWQTNVVPGGFAGGMIGSASVGEGRIAVCTAPGFSVFDPQKPTVHSFDIDSGAVLWQSSISDPCFGPTMGVPGVVVTGGTPRPNLNFFNSEDGDLLRVQAATATISGIASGPTIVSGTILVGGGTGAFNEGEDAQEQAEHDTPLTALCVRGAPGCTPNTCDDGNRCTYDYRNRSGNCVSEPGAEGLECPIGTTPGKCQAGTCVATSRVPPP